ncbi:MAG: LPS export ABC transporter permease LptG [Rhodospirillaceae bacterium]|jgi:lipopolysaccharide export system permease protein|nr:LPS export ABC transporter permease LptG [Rhodospirillaceae bacterium]MBT5459550.1 LPS export ABC transporter permease LptG [Rhodospirillaceae bacterium]
MRLHPTFGAYVGRQFLIWWFSVVVGITILIALIDTVENLRRTASSTDISLLGVLVMTAFKLPHLAQEAIPFTVLFGGMMAFWRLNRHNEFVVARSAGISAWEFLLPILLLSALIGIVKITVYSPFASAMMLRYEQLETKHDKGKSSLAAISGEGLWLRQNTNDGHYILHAAAIDPAKMVIEKVIVFRFKANNRFSSRLDADRASLKDKTWLLGRARLTGPEIPLQHLKTIQIPTDLTRENIQDSFARPETMSFWALPGFIEVLEKAGFSGLRHRIYWYSLIADPFLLCAMALLAAAFTLRPQRRGGATIVIAAGVATGFMIYFASDVVYALGLSARLPALLAAWSPAIIGCLLGTGVLFHMEDG